jgi:cyclophilin family peptidyl-prolyl cis-trans isomerase
VPTDKRQRQKEGRQKRLAAERKAAKQRQMMRRAITIVIIAAVIVTTVYFLTRNSNSTTAATSTTTTTPFTAVQAHANALAVNAGCPAQPATASSPANTLTWTAQPTMSLDLSKTYYATVATTAGTFKMKLNTTTTPVNTNNFVFLAQQKFFHCVPFHRVIPGFMDQTGDPTGTGTGGPGYSVSPNEFPAPTSPIQYPKGAVAMANSCPQQDTPAQCPTTNGSQWFIVAKPLTQTGLPPKYTYFANVISGLKVVEKINLEGNSDPQAGGVPPAVINRILSVTITTS